MIAFLKDLKLLISEKETEYPSIWSDIPSKYKKDFKSWVTEYKQQTWDGMWEKAWYNYHIQFIVFLLDEKINGLREENEM